MKVLCAQAFKCCYAKQLIGTGVMGLKEYIIDIAREQAARIGAQL